MAMIASIDQISRRYGLLPSQTIIDATTYDLFIMDAAMGYERYAREQAEAKANGKPPVPHMDQSTMQKMMERVRNGNK